MFITLDGGDGCGKSTQIRWLAEKLQSQGYEVVCCRDPGSTPLGDAVRNILLNRQELHIADMTEVFLFMRRNRPKRRKNRRNIRDKPKVAVGIDGLPNQLCP